MKKMFLIASISIVWFKTLNTILWPVAVGRTIPCAIPSYLVTIAMFVDKEIPLIARFAFHFLVVAVWLALIVLSFFAMFSKKKKFANIFLSLSIFSAFLDCILPLIFSSLELKIIWSIASAFIICVNAIAVHYLNRAESCVQKTQDD